MTEKQKKFCDEYLIDCNATRAYKAAYPHIKNDNTAGANASRLLRNAKIKEYIDEQLKEMHSGKIADAEEVMEFLSSVMRSDFKGQSVSTSDRLKAAELIGKRYGLYKNTVDVGGSVPVVIVGGDELE